MPFQSASPETQHTLKYAGPDASQLLPMTGVRAQAGLARIKAWAGEDKKRLAHVPL
jgi:hypothetical protein